MRLAVAIPLNANPGEKPRVEQHQPEPECNGLHGMIPDGIAPVGIETSCKTGHIRNGREQVIEADERYQRG